MGWGNVVDRITSWLPIQQRVERWKNELDKLQKEVYELKGSDADEKKSNRYIAVVKRINELNSLLKNKAHDS